MNSLEIVADYQDQCGECPVWDAASGALYWTDLGGRKFYRYDTASRRHEIVHEGFQACGFVLNRGGGFIVTNEEGVWLWDGHQRTRKILGEVAGAPVSLNDCTADPKGRLLTATWNYQPDAKYAPGFLIRVDTDGHAEIIDDGIHGGNGLGFSPDQRTLYFTDTVIRTIYAYNYNLDAGTVSNRRVFVKVPDKEGLPDGLAVDAKGYVWSGQWYGSCFVRYDPEGRIERRLKMPAKQVTSLAFAGKDLTDIYLTSAALSGPLPIMPPGYDPKTGPFGGPLYRINLGIAGKAPFICNFPAFDHDVQSSRRDPVPPPT